jgi:hypothetical protein
LGQVRLVAEMQKGGGVKTWYDSNNARPYGSPRDEALLPVHVIVALFYLWYLVVEVSN